MTMWYQNKVVPIPRKRERLFLCADLEGGCQGTSSKLLLFRVIWARISKSWVWYTGETVNWLLYNNNWLQRNGLSMEAGTVFWAWESFLCSAEKPQASLYWSLLFQMAQKAASNHSLLWGRRWAAVLQRQTAKAKFRKKQNCFAAETIMFLCFAVNLR